MYEQLAKAPQSQHRNVLGMAVFKSLRALQFYRVQHRHAHLVELCKKTLDLRWNSQEIKNFMLGIDIQRLQHRKGGRRVGWGATSPKRSSRIYRNQYCVPTLG